MRNKNIHPSAIIESGAQIGENVKIGPYCTVGAHVTLGDHVELISHVAVAGHTSIGARTRVFPFAALGFEPQDLKFKGEVSTLDIGTDCLIREGVTMNPGTEGGGSITKVGNHCAFLTQSHVAHDCILGNNVIFSNNVMLAGHCRVEDFVIIGGGAGVSQFVRIGQHAFISGMSAVADDVIPYGLAIGNRATLAGLNVVGLKRRGFEKEAVQELRRAYRLLFAAEGTLAERVEDVAAQFEAHPHIHEILDFIRNGSDRPLCQPRAGQDA